MKPEPRFQPGVQSGVRQRPQEPVYQPLPVIQPQQVQQQEQPKQQYARSRIRVRFPHWLFTFLIISGMFTAIWWSLASSVGSIFPDPAWDFWAWVIAEAIFLYGELTGFSEAWARKYCGFHKKEGGVQNGNRKAGIKGTFNGN